MRALACLLFITAPALANPGPLTPAEKATLEALPEDTAPEKLNATREDLEGRHYLSGDEANLHLFYPRLKDLGGAYAGVGSDQTYLFAGWMKPRFAFVTDYDPWIKWLHLSYVAFFRKAETIEEFRSYWKNTKAGLKVIRETYDGLVERRARWEPRGTWCTRSSTKGGGCRTSTYCCRWRISQMCGTRPPWTR